MNINRTDVPKRLYQRYLEVFANHVCSPKLKTTFVVYNKTFHSQVIINHRFVKALRHVCPVIYTVFVSLLISIVIPVSASAETAKIITKENAIRGQCRFFSPIKVRVKYADTVNIISKEGDWFRVRVKGIDGCIHKSAIEEKKFDISGLLGTDKRSTSEAEVALAGKGFNPQVEDAYKKKHGLNFQTVDRIEMYTVSEGTIYNFMQDGGLKLP